MPHSNPLPFERSLPIAINLEDEHIGRFRTWALRLRPFDMSLARILDLQADEMGDHKRMLLDCSTTQTSHLWSRPTFTVHRSPIATEHFFVLNATGATTILDRARALKEEARNFYLQCMQMEADSSKLIRVYQTLQKFKDSHAQILLEAEEGFFSRVSTSRHQHLPEAILQS
jgi:hypothetical protein